jgi:hypothetical protein
MKQIKITTILCSFLFVGLTSCLKERDMNINPDSTPSVVAFGNTGDNSAAATSTHPGFYADLGALAGGASTTFHINVEYEGAETAPADITVNLGIDNNLLTKYNTENGTAYVVPPTSVFALPTSLVIKKGTRTAQTDVKITNNSSFDFNKAYAIPVAITSTSNNAPVSSNFGKAVYSFGVRNVWDGIYSISSGTVTRYTAPGAPANDALSGSVAGNPDLTLTTVGANTVEISNLKWAGGTSGVGGIDNLRVTVDPATNLVTMSSLGNATLANWPGKVNKYDPATKTFYLAFRWNPTANVREYEMVIKYKKAR